MGSFSNDFVQWKDAATQFHVRGMTLADADKTKIINLEELPKYATGEL